MTIKDSLLRAFTIIIPVTAFIVVMDIAVCYKTAQHRARQAIVNNDNSSIVYGENYIEATGKCRYATIIIKHPNVKRIEGREYINGIMDTFRD